MKQRIPNTFGLDVYAEQVIIAHNVEQIMAAYQFANEQHLPMLVLGEGSNTLFTQDFHGVIVINRIDGITIDDQDEAWHLSVGAGVIWHDFVAITIEHGMAGVENLALIPGCVGSAPIQNIGAYGVEFEKVAEYVQLLELETGKIITIADGQYGYRDSIFKHQYLNGYVVVQVGIKLPKAWQPMLNYGELKNFDVNTVTPKMIFDKVCEIRHDKLPDPKVLGNGGSFFKNPIVAENVANKLFAQYPTMPSYPQANGDVKLAAGWLIDQCCLKGFQIGGAAVHENQALVLVNKHQATAQDVIKLARYVRNTVKQKFDVSLEPEIRFIGKQGEIDPITLLMD